MTRQKDIEIYVRGCPGAKLLAWVEAALGPLGAPQEAGKATMYPSLVGPVLVTPGIEGGPFVSVLFSSPDTPWATDVDCAREAARSLGCVVRCDPGAHFPDVPAGSDVFLEVAGTGEKLVSWL